MTQTIHRIVGANVRAIRLAAEKTLDDVVFSANKFGAKWSTGSLGDIESGNRGGTLTNLLLAAAALTDATGHEVTLLQLCAGADMVTVGRIEMDLGDLRNALCGKSVVLPIVGGSIRESEQRLLAALDMSADELAEYSARLWGCSFHDERIRRAGTDANAQRRGRITRELKMELDIARRLLVEAGVGSSVLTRDD